jgi:hypothetical protein
LSNRATLMPDVEAVERLLRYKPAARRQFHEALDALERLQRHRRGEFVPPPVNAHLSLEA